MFSNVCLRKEDERVMIVTITEKGNELKEKCRNIPLELSQKGSPLAEDDVEGNRHAHTY